MTATQITDTIRTQAAYLAHETRRANKRSTAAHKAHETRRINAEIASERACRAWETRRGFRPVLGGSVLVAAV